MRVRRPLAASVAASAALGAAVSLPAVWWEPLHADENVTLEIAPRSFGAIVEPVFVEKRAPRPLAALPSSQLC